MMDRLGVVEWLRMRLVPGRYIWLFYDYGAGKWRAGVLDEDDLVDEVSVEDLYAALERLGYKVGLDLKP